MFHTRPSWSSSPPILGYDKSAAQGHLSWRIQLGKKGVEVHSDIRKLILELLCSPSNEPLRSSTVTRLIWLAGLRVHRLFKVTLKRPGAIVRGRKSKVQWWTQHSVDRGTASRWQTTRHDNLWRSLWFLISRQALTALLYANRINNSVQ